MRDDLRRDHVLRAMEARMRLPDPDTQGMQIGHVARTEYNRGVHRYRRSRRA